MQPSHLRSPFRGDLLAGQVALVTGGGTGIGRAIAHELSACGARVAICGRRPEPIQAVCDEIKGQGGECLMRTCDIREPALVQALVGETLARFGQIDILVNNAGGQRPYPALDMPLQHFEKVVRNNLIGTFIVTREVARAAMVPRRRGAIVSIIAEIYRGFPGMSHTGAARAGVDNLTKSLAVEWSPYKIRVNAVAPGVIRSSGTDRYPQELLPIAASKTPLKRLGTPEEVAHLCVFLVSDAASYITGTTTYIDGGSFLWGDMFPLPDPE